MGWGSFAEFAATNLANHLTFNRFLGAHRAEPVWCVDDDISNLLNIWYNPSLWNNPHYAPEFSTNAVANAGSAIVLGDCYSEQIVKIFRDAKLFEPKKIVQAKRHGAQKAQDFRSIISDLRLVVMTYQSFNTDRLDEREKEIANIFEAMRVARKKFANGKAASIASFTSGAKSD